MDTELIEQIVDYIRKLADPMVTKGYELVLRQVQLQMYFDLFIVVVVGALLGVSLYWIRRINEKLPEEKKNWVNEGFKYDLDTRFTVIVFGAIFIVCGIVVICANISSILNTMINPDWMAIQKIFSLVSGGG